MKPIPIVLMTRDEPGFLKLTVQSIINRTKYPHRIFIVDNNSVMERQISYLFEISNHELITVVQNSKNRWVLGIDSALEIINSNDELNQDFIVLSDGDITVPLKKSGKCWLEYLVEQLSDNVSVGKIGLPLDLGYIRNLPKFNKTYCKELKFDDGQKIGELVVAPVDTTMAIYRKDLYVIGRFRIIPGHASLVKPHYYVTRGSRRYQAKHLGWRNYSVPSMQQLKEKIICFTKYSGYIDPIVLKEVDVGTRMFRNITKNIFKAYWAAILTYHWLKYIIYRFPRNLNEIQARHR